MTLQSRNVDIAGSESTVKKGISVQMKRQTNKSSVQESLQENFYFRRLKEAVSKYIEKLSLSMSQIPLLLLLATVVAPTSSSGDPKLHPSPEERDRRQGGNRSDRLQSYTRTDHVVPRPATKICWTFSRDWLRFKRTLKHFPTKSEKMVFSRVFFALTSKIWPQNFNLTWLAQHNSTGGAWDFKF